MLFEQIAILLPDGSIAQNQYVATKGSEIAYIGAEKPAAGYGETYAGRGRLLLPGFVNAHSHTPMTLMRGYGENLTLHDWLRQRIFPFEAQMTGEDIYWATLLGIAEMVRYGIVSTTDMYTDLSYMARAFAESGAKANLSNGVTNFTGAAYADIAATKDAHAALRDFHMAQDGRIRIDLSVHAEYTSDEETVRAVAEDAQARGLRVHVHVSETRMEHEECKERHGGLTPTQYLAACGLFDTPATAAHCVWIEDADRDILREKGVTVATCPKSNLKLASGVFDMRAAQRAGVRYAIGTDSVASNNNLNMIEELRTFLLAQKGFSGDPTLVTPQEALYAATRAGALAQGRLDCGEIRVGNRADLAVLDIASPCMHPARHLLNNVAYASSGSDIVLTMCDGAVLYRDGTYPTIDIERTLYQVDAAYTRIANQTRSTAPVAP